MSLITRAGLPATTLPSGTSLVTTDPAPTMLPFPIVTPPPLAELHSSTMSGTLLEMVFSSIAAKHGFHATFMPKPVVGINGSGMHTNQSLFNLNATNAFFDEKGPLQLSETAYQYIGGILKNASGFAAITNPLVNSYKRLVPGYEAPVNLFFSVGNRSAAVRIPMYACTPTKQRIEFRPPDATCNVYLALAAQLMAGLDGILNETDPTEAGFGPFDTNVFAWPEKERKQIKGLPASLGEALGALADDHGFLLTGGVMDEEFIQDWIEYKMTHEHLEVRDRPHPYEMALYFDV